MEQGFETIQISVYIYTLGACGLGPPETWDWGFEWSVVPRVLESD
jgi:hypothetical protein